MKIISHRLFLVVCCTLFLFPLLHAGVKISFSAEFKMPKNHYDQGLLGDAARGYMQVSHCEGKSMSFQKFDTNLKLVAENVVSLQDIPKDCLTKRCYDVGKNTFWFYYVWNKAERKNELYARKIDFVKAGFDGNAKLILKTDKLELSPDISQSADKKLVIAHYEFVERDRGANKGQLHGFIVFDENMNKVNSAEIDLPLYSGASSYVDGSGNIYSVMPVKNDTGEYYHSEVFMWAKNNPKPVKMLLNFENKDVDKLMFTEDLSGNVVVASYYTDAVNDNGADGLFLAKVNRETGKMEKVHKGLYSFPQEIRYTADLKKRGSYSSRPDAALQNLVFNPDGTIQAYGELTSQGGDWIWTIVSDNKPYSQEVVTYFNFDILAMSIGKDGEVLWNTRVPKRQKVNGSNYETGADYGNGFADFNFGENKYFFFSDNPENENATDAKNLKFHTNSAKGALMAARIDPSGKISRQLVYNANDKKTFLYVTELHKVSPNQMVATTSADMTMKIALLTIE